MRVLIFSLAGLSCLLSSCDSGPKPSPEATSSTVSEAPAETVEEGSASSSSASSSLPVGAAPEGDPAALIAAAEQLSTEGEGHGLRSPVDGSWWFLRNELKHIASGPYWTATPEGGDPVAAISAYAKGLKDLGVELILVPVPPKASIYPGKLAAGATATPAAPFVAKLAAEGVEVLDLEPLLWGQLGADTKLYCEQDSHWSPATCQLVAEQIAGRYKDADWAKAARRDDIARGEETTIEIHGDLLDSAAKGSDPKETLKISYVGTGGGAVPKAVEPDKASPVMLLGDSHTLVFHSGAEMHTTGAGLADHLAADFGFPVDLEASMGSGGDSARANVARRANGDKTMWSGKKLVIWCFSAREFTQGKWREIKVQP